MLDLVGAGIGVMVLAPLFLVIGVAIVVTEGRPVLFRQVRIGRGGEPFRMLKFRTMLPGADRRGPHLTVEGDDRITALGRLLRQWKLDELPQLLNVLAGEMSLVGPRPEVPRYVDRYGPRERTVLELTPGITDPASVAYRSEGRLLAQSTDPERTYVETIVPDKIRINLAYAERATLWTDLTVILSTLTAGRFPIAWGGAAATADEIRRKGEGG